jgi:PKD repeat protein
MTTISLITPKRLLLIATALMLTLAIAAAAPALSRAAAQTYCVHQAGFTCPTAAVDEGVDLQAALNQAALNPSTASSPNVITIGPGTYRPETAGEGFIAQSRYPLHVNGAGAGQTTLTDSGAEGVISLAGVPGESMVSLSGFTVGGSAGSGVVIADGSIDHVAVDPSGPGSHGENGIKLMDSTVKDSTVTLPAGNDGDGLLIYGGSFSSNEIDDVSVDGGATGITADSGAVVHRARLTGNITASVLVDSAPIYIDDSLLVGTVEVLNSHDAEASVQAVNDTIAAGDSSTIGLVSIGGASTVSDITIYNSIVHGFSTSFETAGATARITAANDNYDGTTLQVDGVITVAGRVVGDPAFVDPGAGDYRLAWNSPLVEAGDTGLVSAASSATDLDGNPREVPSFTASSSPLDVGAYEYQHRVPTAVPSATPSSATAGTAITFDGAHSSDPDHGDSLTYAWSFDDGATATGATVTHAFTTPGAHTATLSVADPTGLTSKHTTTVTVTSPPAPTTSQPTSPTPTTSPTAPTSPSGMTANPGPPHLVVLGKPSVNGNKVTLKLVCTGSTSCTGIRVTETANKTAQVASARLSLEPGQTKAITLALNGKGKRLLAHLGKLPVVIAVTTDGAIVKTAHVTLHPAKRPSHHRP